MQLSVLTIDANSALFFFMQQVGDVGPTAHVQSRRYPFQAHDRFLPQSARQRHFAFIPFGPSGQLLFHPGIYFCRLKAGLHAGSLESRL